MVLGCFISKMGRQVGLDFIHLVHYASYGFRANVVRGAGP